MYDLLSIIRLILGYKKYVAKWFSVLMPLVQPYFYGNGGNIIMVQVRMNYKPCTQLAQNDHFIKNYILR